MTLVKRLKTETRNKSYENTFRCCRITFTMGTNWMALVEKYISCLYINVYTFTHPSKDMHW